jgi:hypothetical protein
MSACPRVASSASGSLPPFPMVPAASLRRLARQLDAERMALLRAAKRVSWEHELVHEQYAGGGRLIVQRIERHLCGGTPIGSQPDARREALSRRRGSAEDQGHGVLGKSG